MTHLEELNAIKKIYGEEFMHFCNEKGRFPTVFETPGLLLSILKSAFGENCRTLAEDIKKYNRQVSFRDYIMSRLDDNSNGLLETEDNEERTPYEILDKAGYTLFECKTEEEIQSFKKYFKEDEALCTFNGGRLDSHIVYFAVRKDVENIKRENFKEPKREDKYGTSVMSIQFNKKGICTASILNRYNHTIKDQNPDATYGNDLDRIAKGLSAAFKREMEKRGLQLSFANIDRVNLPGYVVASDGKLYKYNMEMNGVYYCPGNIVIERNGEAARLPTDNQLLLDYFVLDTKEKTIKIYDKDIRDDFTNGLNDIESIEILRKGLKNGERTVAIRMKEQTEPITIVLDKKNQIIEYKNNGLEKMGDNFLSYNRGIRSFEADNVISVGHNCLRQNEDLEHLSMKRVKRVGDNFGYSNNAMEELELPSLISCGEHFFDHNTTMKRAIFPELIDIGNCFMFCSKELRKLVSHQRGFPPSELLELIRKNNPKGTIRPTVSPTEIAELDKNHRITTEETVAVGCVIESMLPEKDGQIISKE